MVPSAASGKAANVAEFAPVPFENTPYRYVPAWFTTMETGVPRPVTTSFCVRLPLLSMAKWTTLLLVPWLAAYKFAKFPLTVKETGEFPPEEIEDAPGRRAPRSEERRVGKECRSRWSP